MNILLAQMQSKADPSQVEGLSRFFKTGPGQYGEGDRFLGIKVPVTRSVVKECWRSIGFPDLEECIASEYHEIRLAALLSLIEIFRHARKEPATRQMCIDFYLSHLRYINNWDFVDCSAPCIVGAHLLDRPRDILYSLADSQSLWENRISVVSCLTFIRRGDLKDIFALAGIFMKKGKIHDLMQKATGWMLREAGKADETALKAFLDDHAATMPRTMLRYSLERLTPTDRQHYMTV